MTLKLLHDIDKIQCFNKGGIFGTGVWPFEGTRSLFGYYFRLNELMNPQLQI